LIIFIVRKFVRKTAVRQTGKLPCESRLHGKKPNGSLCNMPEGTASSLDRPAHGKKDVPTNNRNMIVVVHCCALGPLQGKQYM